MDDKTSKAEVLAKLISLKNEVDRNKVEAANDRRKIRTDINRKTQEIKTLVAGNKKDIDRLWKRNSDHNQELKEIQGIIKWIEKTIIGIFVTTIITFLFKSFFGI